MMIPSLNWKGLIVLGLIIFAVVWVGIPLVHKGLNSATSSTAS